MPLLGWGVATLIGPFIESIDHWIAFGLLAAIGGHMIVGALRAKDEASPVAPSIAKLLVLALATSVDALAVGVTLPALRLPVAPTVVAVGVVTAAGSMGAARLAGRLRSLGGRAEVLGGLLLIGLGVKILVEHLG